MFMLETPAGYACIDEKTLAVGLTLLETEGDLEGVIGLKFASNLFRKESHRDIRYHCFEMPNFNPIQTATLTVLLL